jgi:aldehyde:ferredoxin oxidoreductase
MDRSYMGKVLWVDLDEGTCTDEEIADDVYRGVLGGLGLAAHLLYERIPAQADPLGPDNVLAFVPGVLTGTSSLFTGRWMAAAKSPLTGGWGDANCGGNLAPAIKKAGYDGIFVRGVASEPVYLLVNDGEAEIRPAGHLWGKDIVDTEDALKDEVGIKAARVACIGEAGEKLSLIAGICNDHGRIAARSGLGAVMGSKKLKALVCAGKHKVGAADRDEMKRLTKACREVVAKDMPLFPGWVTGYLGNLLRWLPVQMCQDGNLYKSMLRKWGTISMNQTSIQMGDAPIKNWAGTVLDFGLKKSATVGPDEMLGTEVKKYNCAACPLGCGGIVKDVPKFGEGHKPEYESVSALGCLLLNEDRPTIYYLNELLNRAGMDTISAGGVAAFAIECFEAGLLTAEDTGGLELRWGDAEAITALIEKIVAREGIGDLLADGVKVAAEKIGGDAARFAVHAGGQELPMHDSRLDPGHGVHYSGDPTPGRHPAGSYLYYEMYQVWKKVDGLPVPGALYGKGGKYVPDEDKAATSAATSKYTAMYNGAGLCMFGAFCGTTRLPLFEWLAAATGFEKSPAEFLECGGHIQTLRQQFNVRHGIDPRSNVAHDRALGRPPQTVGPNRGRTIEIEALLEGYWRELGWDTETGKPTPETLERYGIEG